MFTLGFFSDPGRRQGFVVLAPQNQCQLELPVGDCQIETRQASYNVYPKHPHTRPRFQRQALQNPRAATFRCEQGDNQGRNRCRPGCSEGGVGE
jgi:hypothetical protein